MPVQMNALRSPMETRSKHCIRVTIMDRLDKTGYVVWIIFQIGILDNYDIAIHVLKRCAKCGTFALIL